MDISVFGADIEFEAVCGHFEAVEACQRMAGRARSGNRARHVGYRAVTAAASAPATFLTEFLAAFLAVDQEDSTLHSRPYPGTAVAGTLQGVDVAGRNRAEKTVACQAVASTLASADSPVRVAATVKRAVVLGPVDLVDAATAAVGPSFVPAWPSQTCLRDALFGKV
jgi:hypothetical protein